MTVLKIAQELFKFQELHKRMFERETRKKERKEEEREGKEKKK